MDQSSYNLRDSVGNLLLFPKPFSSCLYHVTFRRYFSLSLEVVEKTKADTNSVLFSSRLWTKVHKIFE